MPVYKPFTEEEKRDILARHHYLVDEMNKTLGDVLEYEDERILQKLEDPKEVAAYRLHEENKRRNEERQRIMDDLESRFGTQGTDHNPLNRHIKYLMKLGDDPKDMEYNEKLYQEYLRKPENVVYREYKKILELNPQQLYDLGDDKQKIAEFYMNNTGLCEGAFVVNSVITNGNAKATKALRSGLASMAKPIESLNEIGHTLKNNGIDSFACPTLTQEQTLLAMTNQTLFLGNPNPVLTEVMNCNLIPIEPPHDYFQKFVDYGIDINQPNFFTKYKCVKTDPETGNKKEVGFSELFDNDDPNVRIEIRSKDEQEEILAVNRAYQDKYAEKFQARIATKLNQMNFDINQLEEERKGNWVERNILHSTSSEWTEFIGAFKDYNNPEHPNYLRKDILKPKAQAYMDRKHRQGYATVEDMKGTSRSRGTLAQAVIDTCDEFEEQKNQINEDIEISIRTGFNGKVGLIINAKEVDVNDNAAESEQEKSNEIKNEIVKDQEPLEM